MAPRVVVVEADGGSRGNPGPAGFGAVVKDPDTGEVLAERSESIGRATNNVAEYRGLIAGLEAAAELGAVEVEARMDSKLVVEQMCGRWQIKHPGLRPLAAQAAGLVARFAAVRFSWIPRERNRHADALANAAMDAAAGGAPVRPAATPAAEPARQVAAADSPARAAAREAAARATAAGAESATRAAIARTTGTDPATAPASWEPRPTFTATRLILVRHGETEYTEQRRYSGRGDVPLSARGRAQIQATAARVAALAPSVAAVVSSPLSRCTTTAEAIAGALGGIPVRREDDLIECDFGAWEGRTFAEVRERWAGEMDAWLASTRVAPPDGESFTEVAERCRRAVAGLLDAYRGETVVVVSHVSPIKLVLRDALAADDAFLHRLFLDAAGISVLDMWPDGGIAVRSVNDTAHLP
ncbi:bifunctional RNase H/acid phosphatase [Micromonospora endolithica]|uniref:Bifunctional RNase H/acid phosphatase n=1 Tax=Micromonospora endolithica TaxID=230091 RepID=A0A3A9ZRQ7_9ACTN|nr:bifunctional RNase H/acid phosphatase [Micromonospora endolithica]RKN50952.1 bifunctional RNase H/acid phosphatase [Micromonospora endolithica]TWJ20266.1 putative phosphoglycerate mutase [Micromonospora endolithica]